MTGRDPRRAKLRAIVEQRGMVSLLNDTKWMRAIDVLRQLPVRFRIKLLTSDQPSDWDDCLLSPVENYVEIPRLGPVLALEIEWLEIDTNPSRQSGCRHSGLLADPMAEVVAALHSVRVPFTTKGAVVRVTGHAQP
jgi:hypothetical protein